ncbi:MAG: LPS export ABC transporter periplasmic protein LptC [Bacteroidetes bacterium]|nr:LPS export ABC transporter periplasmic protein LptC [Bacteroidota bacterium]
MIKSIRTSFLAIFILLFSSCENDDRVLTNWTKQLRLKEEATDVISSISQEGKLKARIKAPIMVKEEGDTIQMTFPQTLHCDFYNDSAKIETRLDAKFGIYYENLNKVFLRDSVVVITEKGDTLMSPELWWDQGSKLFYTDKFASYRSPGQQILGGKGLEATQDLKRITFKFTTGLVNAPENH